MWNWYRVLCAVLLGGWHAAPQELCGGAVGLPGLRVCLDLSECGVEAGFCDGFDLVVSADIWHRRGELFLALERSLSRHSRFASTCSELVVVAAAGDRRIRGLVQACGSAPSGGERGGLKVCLIDSLHGEAVESRNPISSGDPRGERK